MKKLLVLLGSIVIIAFGVIRWINHAAPYIQFSNEVFSSKEVANYRDKNIEITNISFHDVYEAKWSSDQNYTSTAKEGNDYIFIDIAVENNSDQNFDISAMHWVLNASEQGKNKVRNYGADNMDERNMLSISVQPNEKDTNTLVFEIPENAENLELTYYDIITKKPSQTKPISKAPNFKIIIE